MDLNQLKDMEIAYLRSNKHSLHEQGLALRDIIDRCDKHAGPRLSDEVIISDIANEYIKELDYEYSLTKKENLQLKAKIASDFLIYKFASFTSVYDSIVKLHNLNFEIAKQELMTKDFYKITRPETVTEAINLIVLNRTSD